MENDEDLLLAVLNSAPVVNGARIERLTGDTGAALAARYGGVGGAHELQHLCRMRDALHDVIRGHDDATARLGALLADAVLVPKVTPTGISWELRAPVDQRLALRTVQAWSRVSADLPGRVRACANTECNLFLVDHSRPGTAKWCSMSTCGNRMKARAHAGRQRTAGTASR